MTAVRDNLPRHKWRAMSAQERASSSLDLTPRSALQGFVRFAHASIWEHVVMANRRAGASVEVFLHSWHPELKELLDVLYLPAASVHDAPLPSLHKLKSQSLSLKRALALVRDHARAAQRVAVLR